jgi:hypothetical protein
VPEKARFSMNKILDNRRTEILRGQLDLTNTYLRGNTTKIGKTNITM